MERKGAPLARRSRDGMCRASRGHSPAQSRSTNNSWSYRIPPEMPAGFDFPLGTLPKDYWPARSSTLSVSLRARIVPMNGLIAERGAIKKSDHLACQGIPFVGDPADRSQELDAASALGADEKHWTLCRRRNL
jgi:hypothetical protein